MADWDDIRTQRQRILDVREDEKRREGAFGRTTAWIGGMLAHPLFFLFACLSHLGWIVLNIPSISPLRPWDPPPFELLSMIASVEAPLLALLILMRQQQDRRVNELREDLDLQVTLHIEREVSQLIEMTRRTREALGVSGDEDPEVEAMERPLDSEELLHSLEARHEEDASAPEPE